jgi:hypothetical protein
MKVEQLQAEIEAFERLSYITSDRLCGVVYTFLTQKGIKPEQIEAKAGYIQFEGDEKISHFWLDTPDGRIDLSARTKLKRKDIDVPHGLFNPDDFPKTKYCGFKINMAPLSEKVYDLIVTHGT